MEIYFLFIFLSELRSSVKLLKCLACKGIKNWWGVGLTQAYCLRWECQLLKVRKVANSNLRRSTKWCKTQKKETVTKEVRRLRIYIRYYKLSKLVKDLKRRLLRIRRQTYQLLLNFILDLIRTPKQLLQLSFNYIMYFQLYKGRTWGQCCILLILVWLVVKT